MSGLSPKLPLSYSHSDGHYELNKTHKEVISQNLKHLCLTSPGEKIMDINFGVGLYNFLFENDTIDLQEDIKTRINEQVSRYMPFVEIVSVDILSGMANSMNVSITYFIPSLNIDEALEISVSNI